MTDNNHPIPPLSLELVEQWCNEDGDEIITSPRWFHIVCTKAARWGADQELDACCDWLLGETEQSCINELRAARRPKPPSQAEEALEAVAAIENMSDQYVQFEQDIDTIRSALDRLQELEGQGEA